MLPKPKRARGSPALLEAPISSLAQREPTENTQNKQELPQVWLLSGQQRLPSDEVHGVWSLSFAGPW